MQRLTGIDCLRGLALVGMTIFHFSYDLGQLSFIDFSLSDPFWKVFRASIVTVFCFCVGYSFRIALDARKPWKAMLKRISVISSWALAITLTSLILIPEKYVYFGILHFIALSTLLLFFIAKYRWVCLSISLIIWIGWGYFGWAMSWLFNFLQPALHLSNNPLDVTHFIPWFASVTFGSFIAGMSIAQERTS